MGTSWGAPQLLLFNDRQGRGSGCDQEASEGPGEEGDGPQANTPGSWQIMFPKRGH